VTLEWENSSSYCLSHWTFL